MGSSVAREYNDQLPFLLKLLAAEDPLSLQAHPTKEQAESGFDREDRLGIERGASHRNYRDRNHKPELLVALTPFDALCGFRPVDKTIELFKTLNLRELDRYLTMLEGVEPSEALRSLFTTWITLPSDPRQDLIDALVRACQDHPDVPEAQTVLHLAENYPGDPGVLCALLLNQVHLRPGEAIYLDAGQLHDYLHGMGVEIMANSDNVLRGGLTSKHIDVPELMRVLTFDPLADPVLVPHTDGELEHYVVKAPEFTLWRADADHTFTAGGQGPQIVLCTAGTATVDGVSCRAGEAILINDSDGEVSVSTGAESQVFVAAVGGRAKR